MACYLEFMTNTELPSARTRLIAYAAATRTVTTDGLAPHLDAFRAEILDEAIEAARDQYLSELIDNPEDEAYQTAVSHVIDAISVLLEGK